MKLSNVKSMAFIILLPISLMLMLQGEAPMIALASLIFGGGFSVMLLLMNLRRDKAKYFIAPLILLPPIIGYLAVQKGPDVFDELFNAMINVFIVVTIFLYFIVKYAGGFEESKKEQ